MEESYVGGNQRDRIDQRHRDLRNCVIGMRQHISEFRTD